MYRKIISIAFIIVVVISVFCGCSGKITPSPNHTDDITSPTPIITTPGISPEATITPALSPDISPDISGDTQSTPKV